MATVAEQLAEIADKLPAIRQAGVEEGQTSLEQIQADLQDVIERVEVLEEGGGTSELDERITALEGKKLFRHMFKLKSSPMSCTVDAVTYGIDLIYQYYTRDGVSLDYTGICSECVPIAFVHLNGNVYTGYVASAENYFIIKVNIEGENLALDFKISTALLWGNESIKEV